MKLTNQNILKALLGVLFFFFSLWKLYKDITKASPTARELSPDELVAAGEAATRSNQEAIELRGWSGSTEKQDEERESGNLEHVVPPSDRGLDREAATDDLEQGKDETGLEEQVEIEMDMAAATARKNRSTAEERREEEPEEELELTAEDHTPPGRALGSPEPSEDEELLATFSKLQAKPSAGKKQAEEATSGEGEGQAIEEYQKQALKWEQEEAGGNSSENALQHSKEWIASLLQWKYAAAFVFACFSGILAGMFGVGGPPLMIYYALFPVHKSTMRACNIYLNCPRNLLALATLYYEGMLHLHQLWPVYLCEGIGALLGVAAGDFLHRYFSSSQVLRVVMILLLVQSISLILSSSLSLL